MCRNILSMRQEGRVWCSVVVAVVVVVMAAVAAGDRQERQASRCEPSEPCTPFRSCRTFQELLQNPTAQVLRRLRAAVCNRDRQNLKVCCPGSTTVTPTPTPTPTPTESPVGGGEALLVRSCATNEALSTRAGVLPLFVAHGKDVTVENPRPWTALLGYSSTSSPLWGCGGTLITEQYVLTAAHCVHLDFTFGSQLSVVRLGELNLDTARDCSRSGQVCAPQPQDFTPAQVTIHLDFDTRVSGSDDIALIRLNRKATLNSHVKPLCLPAAGVSVEGVLGGQQAEVAGWGITGNGAQRSQILQRASLAYVDKATCAPHFDNQLVPEQVCFGGGVQDSCRGDSGGPLVVGPQSSRPLLVGIVSRGKDGRCATVGIPAAYTYVAPYRTWIAGLLRV